MGSDEVGATVESLGVRGRIASAVVGAVVSTGFVGYVLWQRQKTVTTPECANGPTGCVARVTDTPDSAVAIALLFVAAMFLLIAATGRVFKVSLPGGTTVEPMASTVQDKPPGVRPVQSVTGIRAGSSGGVAAWRALPPDVRMAAENLWYEWNPDSDGDVARNLLKVERTPGKGPHPYYLTFGSGGGERTMKVTLSGRNYSGPRASEDGS